ncbi:MAG: transcriptional repressor [Desulfarculales bacterium]|nr:transcriptional repressor [Desulfarculales bacterium]
MRKTRQRQVILEELGKVNTHPTAAELCTMVRRRMPHISLGTVYRNLDILSRSGAIARIDVGGEEMRFDAAVSRHYHLRCLRCGSVEDVDLPVMGSTLEEAAAKLCQAQVCGHNLEFVGYCRNCCAREVGF